MNSAKRQRESRTTPDKLLPRYFRVRDTKNGQRHYFWEPASRLRGAGYRTIRLSDSLGEAVSQAERLNGLHDNGQIPLLEDFTLPPRRLSMMLAGARGRAKKRGLPCTLTMGDLQRLITRTYGLCEVTGVPFDTVWRGRRGAGPWAPSIDRIENGRGYEFDNCRITTVFANMAMRDWGSDVFDVTMKHLVAKESAKARNKSPHTESKNDLTY